MDCARVVFSGHVVARMFEWALNEGGNLEMTCPTCRHAETNPGVITVALQRGETTVILKQVSAEICDNCGEYYRSSDVTALVMEKAERAVRSGAEVEILRFAA